eukprot:scaffold82054_cov28-Tisochrysis_lutea.AAC.2
MDGVHLALRRCLGDAVHGASGARRQAAPLPLTHLTAAINLRNGTSAHMCLASLHPAFVWQANGEARFAARLTGAACGERHLGIHATAELAALEVARAQREEKRERRVLSLLRCSVACPAENVAFNRYETISSLKDARGNSTERFRKSPMQKHILVERRCWTSQELQQLRRLVEDQRPNRQDEGDRAILGSNDSNGESISVLSSKFWVQIANHHRSLSGIHRSPAAIRQRFRRMVHSAVVPPMPPLVV